MIKTCSSSQGLTEFTPWTGPWDYHAEVSQILSLIDISHKFENEQASRIVAKNVYRLYIFVP